MLFALRLMFVSIIERDIVLNMSLLDLPILNKDICVAMLQITVETKLSVDLKGAIDTSMLDRLINITIVDGNG